MLDTDLLICLRGSEFFSLISLVFFEILKSHANAKVDLSMPKKLHKQSITLDFLSICIYLHCFLKSDPVCFAVEPKSLLSKSNE